MIADVPVRLATLGDALEIAEMSRDYIEQGLRWRWRASRISKVIADPDTNVAVVGEHGALTAFGIMHYADRDAHLLLFAVRPKVRRHGVGSATLIWLETVARSAGARRIRLEARRDNEAARSFYSEHGYHERAIRPGMYSELVDGVRLEKWLRAEPGLD